MSSGRALYTYSELEGGGQLYTRWPGDGEQLRRTVEGLGESEKERGREWEKVTEVVGRREKDALSRPHVLSRPHFIL